MHFPVNQLAHCAAVLAPSPLWLSGSVSDLKLSPETTSHRNLLRLSSLICMLSFSFLFPLAVNFSAISFGAPQIRPNIIMRRSLWCVLYVRCTLWRRLHQQMETDKKLITITFIQSLQRLQHVQPAGLAPASSGALSYICTATAPCNCPTPCCVTLRRLRGRAPKLALIRDNH